MPFCLFCFFSMIYLQKNKAKLQKPKKCIDYCDNNFLFNISNGTHFFSLHPVRVHFRHNMCLCCLYKPFPSHLNYFKLRLFIHTLSSYALCANTLFTCSLLTHALVTLSTSVSHATDKQILSYKVGPQTQL